MARSATALTAYTIAFSEIEDYDKVMLLTWNPKPRFYNYDPYGENDYEMQWWTMLKVLLEADRCCSRFAFVPEISDDGKLHMHGWFVIKDKVKYHKSFLPSLKRGGFIKKSKANSHDWKTFKYHVKDLQPTSDYLKDYDEYVVTHFNVKAFKKHYHVREMLIATGFDKKIKKKNVMLMLEKELLLEESL